MKPEKPSSRRLNSVINRPTDLSTINSNNLVSNTPVQSRSRVSGHGVSQTPSTGLRHPSFGGRCRKAMLRVCRKAMVGVPESYARCAGKRCSECGRERAEHSRYPRDPTAVLAIRHRQLQPHRHHHHQRHVHRRSFRRFPLLGTQLMCCAVHGRKLLFDSHGRRS